MFLIQNIIVSVEGMRTEICSLTKENQALITGIKNLNKYQQFLLQRSEQVQSNWANQRTVQQTS